MSLKSFFLVILLTAVKCTASYAFEASPKDSTTNLKDRTAALLLIEEGKELYLDGKLREALIKFKLAGNKDVYNSRVPFWTGMCHYRLKNYGYALQYAQKAKEISEPDDLDVNELLAYSYHSLNKLDSALFHYDFCLKNMQKQRIKDLRIVEKIAECNYALEQQKSGKVNMRRNFSMDINSDFNDYGALLVNDGKVLYFTSRRENTTGGLNNPDDEQYFEDNYRAVWNAEDGRWDSITNNLDRINSAGFDCISWLSPDGLKCMMTLNTTAVKVKEQTKSSDICEVSLSNKGKWQSPKIIDNKSVNSTFFDGSATLSADGNTMYFVTDRKGDKSMTDIYVVQKENKKWGTAKPVSDSINTEMRETTPYITPDGRYLFFSSDGHPGMGGYDIFVSENMGKYWSKPKNLGIQINSVNDETHFQLYEKLGKILFAGCRIDGMKSNMDVYEIDLKSIELPVSLK
ncbi:MAG: hypothetical protein K0R65_490 [Crocinitomicaceae bacterium]|jgi:tetratricopeptide (TPR) repeat protein|nr:hypothetical protein [Crocinitomicaceae bacterium]